MQEDDLRLAADVHVPVLITAETSREREVYARLIHVNGARARGPFVKIGPQVVAADEGGAVGFGRTRSRAGGPLSLRCRFEEARGGTLFIDDVVALTADAQMQLLSLIDEHARASAGAPAASVAVRVIAGASRHFGDDRASGAFYEPLFYRLNVIHMDLTVGIERR
jgi:DNA-binding NtrC family response regulator